MTEPSAIHLISTVFSFAPFCILEPVCGCHRAGTWFMKGGKDRQRKRSKTFEGIAKAMAEQWAGKVNLPEMCRKEFGSMEELREAGV